MCPHKTEQLQAIQSLHTTAEISKHIEEIGKTDGVTAILSSLTPGWRLGKNLFGPGLSILSLPSTMTHLLSIASLIQDYLRETHSDDLEKYHNWQRDLAIYQTARDLFTTCPSDDGETIIQSLGGKIETFYQAIESLEQQWLLASKRSPNSLGLSKECIEIEQRSSETLKRLSVLLRTEDYLRAAFESQSVPKVRHEVNINLQMFERDISVLLQSIQSKDTGFYGLLKDLPLPFGLISSSLLLAALSMSYWYGGGVKALIQEGFEYGVYWGLTQAAQALTNLVAYLHYQWDPASFTPVFWSRSSALAMTGVSFLSSSITEQLKQGISALQEELAGVQRISFQELITQHENEHTLTFLQQSPQVILTPDATGDRFSIVNKHGQLIKTQHLSPEHQLHMRQRAQWQIQRDKTTHYFYVSARGQLYTTSHTPLSLPNQTIPAISSVLARGTKPRLSKSSESHSSYAMEIVKQVSTHATGLLALSSSSPLVQLAGCITLLSSYLRFHGVSAQQINSTFLTTIGGKKNYTGKLSLPVPEGGSLVVGQFEHSFVNNDFLIEKHDATGNLIWAELLGSPGAEFVLSAWLSSDNQTFFITGDTCNGFGCIVFLGNLFLSNGTKNWLKYYSGSSANVGMSGVESSDGKQFILAWTGPTGPVDIQLIVATPFGNFSSGVTLSGPNSNLPMDLKVSRDGTFLMATGYQIPSNTSIGYKALFILFNATTGLPFLINTIGKIGTADLGNSITERVNGDSTIIGYTYTAGPGLINMLLLRFSKIHNFLYALTVGHPDFYVIANSAVTLPNDHLVVTGRLVRSGKNHLVVIKVDSMDNLLWSKILKRTSPTIGSSIRPTSDNGFEIVGSSDADGIILLKLNENGDLLDCNEMEPVNLTAVNITHLMNVSTSPFNVTSFNLTTHDWPISPQPIQVNQTRHCTTFTHSPSLERSATRSMSIPSESLTNRQTSTRSFSSGSTSFTNDLTFTQSSTQDTSFSHSNSNSPSDTYSDRKDTRTLLPTRTRPIRQRPTSVLIQEFKLDIAGILKAQISPSGSSVVIQTTSAFQFIKVENNGALTPGGTFSISRPISAIAFSADERYLFVADNQKNIQIIDVSGDTPVSNGIVSIGDNIYSLASSGDGTHLLVGTDSGVKVLSAKTPSITSTLTQTQFLNTAQPVQAIQTNPNTNLVAVGSGRTMTLFDFPGDNITVIDEQVFPQSIRAISPVDQTNPGQLTLTLNNGETVFMNVTTPTTPFVLSTLSGPSTALRAVSNNTLLVAGVRRGIEIYENTLKNWTFAPETGYSPVTGTVTTMAFSSNGKFGIYCDEQGVKLIKILRNPGRLDVPLPILLNDIRRVLPVRNILLKEEESWIAIWANRLTFISLKDLKKPRLLGSYNTSGSVQKMVFFPDKTNLLVSDESGISFVNCFDPTHPREEGRWNTLQPIYDVILSGPHAYVCQGEAGIAVLDMTNFLQINQVATLQTSSSAQSIRFNRDRTLAFVADGAGIDILKMKTPRLSERLYQFNMSGFVSKVLLSQDEQSLYFANNDLFGQLNISDVLKPKLMGRTSDKDIYRPIKDILLNHQDTVAFVATETQGLLFVDTKTMTVKYQIPGKDMSAIALNEFEDRIYLADMEGGLKIAELIEELPIIALTPTSSYPVDIRTEDPLLFFNRNLQAVTVDRIVSIQYVKNGLESTLPFEIVADLAKQTIAITAPRILTDQSIQLAIEFELNGVTQKTFFQTTVSSSLKIDAQKEAIKVSSPATTVFVNVTLNGAVFVSKDSAELLTTKMFIGNVQTVNQNLNAGLIVPNPITRSPSEVGLNTAQIIASDTVNQAATTASIPLRYFRFKQAPFVNGTLNIPQQRLLTDLNIKIPSTLFVDPDGFKLFLSVEGPAWLTVTDALRGYVPISMQNQNISIKLKANNSFYVAELMTLLRFDSIRRPYVVNYPSPITKLAGDEFEYEFSSSTFGGLDNETMKAIIFEKDSTSDKKPGFLELVNNRILRGNPSPSDVVSFPWPIASRTHSIVYRAWDKFNIPVEVTLEITLELKMRDILLNISTLEGLWSLVERNYRWIIVLLILVELRGRPNLIKHLFFRGSYFTNEVPEGLLNASTYRPSDPEGKIIALDEKRVSLQRINTNKWMYSFFQERIDRSIWGYIHDCVYANPLVNDLLPKWLELDPNIGLKINPEHLPIFDEVFLFRAIGKYQNILISFILDTSKLSRSRSTVHVSQFVDSGSDIELKPINDTHDQKLDTAWAEEQKLRAEEAEEKVRKLQSAFEKVNAELEALKLHSATTTLEIDEIRALLESQKKQQPPISPPLSASVVPSRTSTSEESTEQPKLKNPMLNPRLIPCHSAFDRSSSGSSTERVGFFASSTTGLPRPSPLAKNFSSKRMSFSTTDTGDHDLEQPLLFSASNSLTQAPY